MPILLPRRGNQIVFTEVNPPPPLFLWANLGKIGKGGKLAEMLPTSGFQSYS